MVEWTLTTALLAVGVLLLAALAGWGWWQTRRLVAPREVEAAPARLEPALDAQGGAAAQAAGAEGEGGFDTGPARPPGSGAAAEGLGADARPTAAPRRNLLRLDPLIDAVVPIALDSPVAGATAVAHLPSSWRAGSKPFHIEGLNAETHLWEQPVHGQRYSEFQAGVQLASRTGALNEIEYSEFVQKVQRFCEAIGGVPDFPDMLDAVGRARELDAFAGPLDAQLSLTLRANSVAWSVGYLNQCAQRQGFSGSALPGRLVLAHEAEPEQPMLVLAFDPQAAMAEEPMNAAVREAQLLLDVPQSPPEHEPFPTWHRVATALADEMDATLVDDAGRPVTLHAFDAIGKELEVLYQTLQARDLNAGSAAARRLFS